MPITVSLFSYLVSAVCCIMALRGLSGPQTAQNGLRFGIG
ncbi:MAG: NAD(P)(+) transhydrogenase (Re/Si-specific) subunit beta, partial [Alphaproteobacteria bacterium]|nr:NAD(P)(+) transhydrogenase (Re/Si-specific) subunit beta [Alphaproteobacteria bacterium]